jgi:succinylglutamic semialdehyde dehydrogenase
MSELKCMQSKGQFIGGVWHKNKGTILESINPATGTILWQGLTATTEEIEWAYAAAEKALHPWASTPLNRRIEILTNFAEQILQNKSLLANLISLETGKPLWESETEAQSVHAKIAISIKAYHERTSDLITKNDALQSAIRYKPHGVVAVLGAFNFPAHLSNGHITPALLAGNTIVYKPSELAPAVAEFIMECWQNAGLPEGVINCIQGDASVAKELLNKDIQGVYFTGSYTTGLHIHQQFANRPNVILALEMGGNNPLVVDEVNDIEAALYHTLVSCFITSGQRCTCARRVIIPNSAFGDEFLQRFIKATQKISVAPFYSKPEPFMGPIISYLHALKHLHTQKSLQELGATALLPMTLLQEYTGLLSPGIIDISGVVNPPDTEVFAPLAQIVRYQSFSQAISIANQTHYGLAAGLLSDDKTHYEQFYQEIRAGLINWNRPTTGAASNLPFGGVGYSGNHRPSAYFAADYCAYPISSMEETTLTKPSTLFPGLDYATL